MRNILIGWVCVERNDKIEGKREPQDFQLIYLIIGTGKACAWQRRLKLESIGFSKMLPFDSELKTGALNPTGSGKIKEICLVSRSLIKHKGREKEHPRMSRDQRITRFQNHFITGRRERDSPEPGTRETSNVRQRFSSDAYQATIFLGPSMKSVLQDWITFWSRSGLSEHNRRERMTKVPSPRTNLKTGVG